MAIPRPTMAQLTKDFLEESEKVYSVLVGLSDEDFKQQTLFKGWTINRIIGHLHAFNNAADLTVRDPETFKGLFSGGFTSIEDFEVKWLKGLQGPALLKAWRELYLEMAERFPNEDPKRRVQWFGPPMGVGSKLSARIMETWAHAQAIFDALDIVRTNTDSISNIVVMGVNTYNWTYQCRGESPPGPMPHLKLAAPSGQTWSFGDTSDISCVTGSAEEFCQVVTQCRNIQDTKLAVVGAIAEDWMSKAQCFAGGPEPPPSPGERRISKL